MSTFSYKARNSAGKVITGEKEAEQKKEIYKFLSNKDLYVIEVKEKSEKSSFFSLQLTGKKRKVKAQELIVFTRQLSTMIHAGLPLLEGIKVMINQVENPGFKEVLTEVRDDISGGATFSNALSKHPKIFDEMYVNMVAAGEEAGVLDEILNRITKIKEKDQDTKNRIKSAFTYPVIIIIIAVTVVGFLTTFVFPKFIKLFIQNNVSLPLPTQILFSFSNFVRGYWYVLVAAGIIGVVALKKYRETSKGRYVTDKIILKIPMVGDLVKKVVLGRFARTLATLYSSGVKILEALEIVKKSVTNVVIVNWMSEVQKGVRKGKSLAEPMQKSGNFPPMLVQMVATGEETGSVSEMLKEIANAYDVEVDYTIKTVTDAIEPLLIVFMGIIVGFTALSLFLPMFDMMSLVKK